MAKGSPTVATSIDFDDASIYMFGRIDTSAIQRS